MGIRVSRPAAGNNYIKSIPPSGITQIADFNIGGYGKIGGGLSAPYLSMANGQWRIQPAIYDADSLSFSFLEAYDDFRMSHDNGFRTPEPSVSGAGNWKFGLAVNAQSLVLHTGRYLEVSVNNSIYKLALVL